MAIYRVRTVFSGLPGAPYLNTLYFLTTGGTAAQAVAAAGAFWGAMDAQLDSELTWATEAEVATLNEQTGAIQAIDAVTPVAGTGSSVGPQLPPAIQGLVRWVTAGFSDGRRIRGRSFVPGLTENQVDNGVLTAAVIAVFQAAADALIADAASTLAVWQRPRAANPTAVPPVTARTGRNDAVVSATVWNQGAVLRSRRP